MTIATGQQFLKKELAVRKELDIRSGDTVRVYVKIEEKGKTRTQIFEGLVIARKHGAENGGTFTVRKIASGIGVERIFPLYSPMIDKIEIVKRSHVRQSKIYFIRGQVARQIRRTMRNFVGFFATTDDLQIPADEMEPETPQDTPAESTNEDSDQVAEKETTTEQKEVEETPETPEASQTKEEAPVESEASEPTETPAKEVQDESPVAEEAEITKEAPAETEEK